MGRLRSKVDLDRVGLGRWSSPVVSTEVEGRLRSGRVDGRPRSGRPRSIAGRRGSAVFFGRVDVILVDLWSTHAGSSAYYSPFLEKLRLKLIFHFSTKITNKTPTLNLIILSWVNSKNYDLGSFNKTNFRIPFFSYLPWLRDG